ncbi:hypothetical protein [Pseudoalteromonas peptidolytica]|uniref:hypothetical protein n=1 Tax=Pseudoalteromonas peptidolytica TaxID=61150 RepID=UPI00298EA04F|nr:hypothetical protein [Pseudoalteromonas peptidolytica]MDW7550188.1 hypothetical protein [Pseudoalteromonas peptidolytica]
MRYAHIDHKGIVIGIYDLDSLMSIDEYILCYKNQDVEIGSFYNAETSEFERVANDDEQPLDLTPINIESVTNTLSGYENNTNEFTVPQQSNDVIATGQLAIDDCKFKVPFKRIDTGRIQLMPAQVKDGQFLIPLRFETNGIWIVDQALINADLPKPVFELEEYRFSVL